MSPSASVCVCPQARACASPAVSAPVHEFSRAREYVCPQRRKEEPHQHPRPPPAPHYYTTTTTRVPSSHPSCPSPVSHARLPVTPPTRGMTVWGCSGEAPSSPPASRRSMQECCFATSWSRICLRARTGGG
eukprot:9495753-Pyramimonas_sp.AAC.2